MENPMRSIRLENVSKKLNGEIIIDGLNLDIPGEKFFALLGPSGCGKTTLLRLIAGLSAVDSGKIFLGNEEITNVPIYKRRIHTVFQEYALFPHMNVFDNIAYSLKIRSLNENIIRSKVFNMLSMIRLTGCAGKNINELSGGQRQRVALARAIINEPVVLLLDEPLAALDQKLKEEMLIELIDLQDRLKTTFVYVTHDQEEALTLSDQMAIMNFDGVLEQIGTPKEIYESPKSRFVANFVGRSNLLKGSFNKVSEKFLEVSIEGLGFFQVLIPNKENLDSTHGDIYIGIRPEKIEMSTLPLDGFENSLKGIISDIIYYGRSTQYNVRLNNNSIISVFSQNKEHFPKEKINYFDKVNLYFQAESVILLER
jgi:spermidine/putrescine transport system ATP-binding protein